MTERIVTAVDGGQTIEFTREFAAPAALVHRAHLDAELIARWIGPRGTSVRVDAWEPRTGGGYRYAVVTDDGSGAWEFFGSFHEVADDRLVQSWEYLGDPGHPTFEVMEFEDLPGGRSRIRSNSVFLSNADRDAALADFDQGRDTDFERLDELLPELAARD